MKGMKRKKKRKKAYISFPPLHPCRPKPRLLNNAFAQRATSNSAVEKDKENQKRIVATTTGAAGAATGSGPGIDTTTTTTTTTTGLFGAASAGAPISKDEPIF